MQNIRQAARRPSRKCIQWYCQFYLSNDALKLIDSNNSYGNSLSETSLLALHKVSSAYKRAMSMKKKVFELESGNMRLPERMASSLSDPPILGEQVVSVNRSDGFVRVNTYSGK